METKRSSQPTSRPKSLSPPKLRVWAIRTGNCIEFRQDYKAPTKLISKYTKKNKAGQVSLNLQQVFYVGGVFVGSCSVNSWYTAAAGAGCAYGTCYIPEDGIVKVPPALGEKVLNEDFRVKVLKGL